ncbi:MAG: methylamine utilization protein [Methylococcales bacterium]
MANCLSSVFLATCCMTFIFSTEAVTLSGSVDTSGSGLSDVVVTAKPLNEDRKKTHEKINPVSMVLDQKSREFIPHVLAIKVGTPVFFPNSDDIRHHVYSFSPAKRFEIKLYSGTPKKPVVFDQPGVVVVGCNIHDWMLGYIVVTDSPYVTKTDDQGNWSLELPDGRYQLSLWHPDSIANFGSTIDDQLVPTSKHLHHTITLKANPQTGKPPSTLQLQGYKDGF